MAKCIHCGQRKGKRPCLALAGDICSPCCGKHRGRDIDCPSDCKFLGGATTGDNADRRASDRLLDKMIKFASKRSDLGKEAMEVFLGARREMEEWEQPAAIHHMLFVFCGGDGKTMAEHFQREQGWALHPAERDALQALQEARFSLYEVCKIQLDEGVRVRDMVLGEELFVHERLATHDLQRFDLVMAWIMWRNGRNEFTGAMTLVHRQRREPVLAAIQAQLEEARMAHPEVSDGALMPETAVAGFQALRKLIREWRPPKITTSDGEEMVFSTAVFDVEDPENVRGALAQHPDIEEEEDNNFGWVDRSGRPGLGDGSLSLGSITVRDERLVLRTNSSERLERGKAFLSGLLGDLVRHRADSLEDLEMAMSHREAAPTKEREEIPPEVEAEILGRFMQQHLMDWIDEEIPMLGGKTPRQTVRTKGGREKVLAMLRDQENLYAGRPGADRVDFTAPYKELGLDYDE